MVCDLGVVCVWSTQRYGKRMADLALHAYKPAVVELDLEVADGERAQDLAHHAQHLRVRHHDTYRKKKKEEQQKWDPRVVYTRVTSSVCMNSSCWRLK